MTFNAISFAALRSRILLTTIFPIVLLVITACQSSIQVSHPAAPSRPIATVVPSMHSLAIVGVDFDPSLDGQRFVAEGGVRLLVAVENQGRTQELNIQVMAQLLDSAGRAEGDTLLNETVVIEALDPGEIRLVPFSPVTTLPPRGRYKLVVQLSAAHDETELQDNSRAYDIVVNDAQ